MGDYCRRYFGQAMVVIGGVEQKAHFFVLDLSHSDGCYVRAYPAAVAEASVDGHIHAFAFFGWVPQLIVYDNDRYLVAKILPDGTRKRAALFSGFLSHYLIRDRSSPIGNMAHASSRSCRHRIAPWLSPEVHCQTLGGLCLLLTDGRIEIDNNTVERTIRPIALNRKNALFAGHEAGAQNWAAIASLIETCKLNPVDTQTHLAATLTAIVNCHKQSRIDELNRGIIWEENKTKGPGHY